MNGIDADIIETFRNNFSKFKDQPIVLYGVGEKTKLLLDYCGEYNFVGIMDGKQTGSCYGLPILTEDLAAVKARIIIIVCNISSLWIIYNRIAKFSNENMISVFHISGKEMKLDNCISKKLYLDMGTYINAIQEHDVISFDVFDTLIMRQCLYPDDLFSIMDVELSESGICQPEFAKYRKEAERQANRRFGNKCTLEGIYQIYAELTEQKFETIKDLLDLEWKYELQYCVSRKGVVELLEFAQKLGKEIILVSDMYLTEGQLRLLLKNVGIETNDTIKIFVSCEAGMIKSDGSLWKYIKDLFPQQKILHLGDNEVSDEIMPARIGVDTLHINSGIEIASYILNETLEYEKELECRKVLGALVANIFNSPFCLNADGKIEIESLHKVGFSFFGPLIKYFMDQTFERAQSKRQKILFLARDGWVLKNIADKYYSSFGIETKYFLVSRSAMALSTIFCVEDIDFVFDIFATACEYSFREFCKVIFDIDIGSNDIYALNVVSELQRDVILDHTKKQYGQLILEKSSRQNFLYREYLKNVNIDVNEKLAIVNYVGSGVTQSLFERFGFKTNSEYYYFALTPRNIEIDLMAPTYEAFDGGSLYTSKGNAVVEYTILGECVFTSPNSQFMGFDDNMGSVYADDGVNPEYQLIRECHEGIFDYYEIAQKLNINFKLLPSEFINKIYGVLFESNKCFVDERVRKAFQLKNIVKSGKIYKVWAD